VTRPTSSPISPASRCTRSRLRGNCIRNISADQYAGVAADEAADPRPWAELLRQWSSFHPEFTYLPRKFKICVIASPEDRAAMRLHDIGLELVKKDGVVGARVFVGGGMGRTPMVAPEVNPFVTEDELISYVEACLRVYNRYGRRDNKYKARIKILVHELGVEEYRRQVAEEFAHMKTLGLNRHARNWRGLPSILPIRPMRPACRTISTAQTLISLSGSTATSPSTSRRAMPSSISASSPSAASPAMRAPSRLS
jgi:sulfite reductase beta subunit-like hemoprotein